MTKNFKVLLSVLLMIGLTSCNAAEKQDAAKSVSRKRVNVSRRNTAKKQTAPAWQKNLNDTFAYRVDQVDGLSMTDAGGGRHALQGGTGGFSLILRPTEGDAWNMNSVSILGLMLKNTGSTEMILDLMLANDGATGWSNSGLGRAVVKPGEELPLGVVFYRPHSDNANIHYDTMSGKPSGHRKHWHTIDPVRVRFLRISCANRGQHSFEIAQMFPYQKIEDDTMAKTPFIDEYGQYMHNDWPGKVRSDRDIISSISAEKKLAAELGKPAGFTKYGGWEAGPKFRATGFFRTERYKGKWWFVDPEGSLFWSYGVTCIGFDVSEQAPLRGDLSVFKGLPEEDDPELGRFFIGRDIEGPNHTTLKDVLHYDFPRANLFKKYGEKWQEKSIAQTIKRLKYCNLNTIGAWSDNEIVSQKKVPYTAMIHFDYAFASTKLPDPFDPETRAGLRKVLKEYPVSFKYDPWCLGVFVNNELQWENNSPALAAAILGYPRENTEVKKVFQKWLKKKYTLLSSFNLVWHTDFKAWEDLLTATDPAIFRQADLNDSKALVTLIARAYFKMVTEELTRYSPNHLYLGCRLNSGSTEVIRAADSYVDVVSANIYKYRPDIGAFGFTEKPVLISEFHFASAGARNLGGGLRSAQCPEQQARLFRAFMAEAVDNEKIIGAHWFQWKDQNVSGRYDGENYDIGFFDVADMPKETLIRTAEEFGRTLYDSLK